MRKLVLAALCLGLCLAGVPAAAGTGARPISGKVQGIDLDDRTFKLGPVEVYAPVGTVNLSELEVGQDVIVRHDGSPGASRVTALEVQVLPQMD